MKEQDLNIQKLIRTCIKEVLRVRIPVYTVLLIMLAVSVAGQCLDSPDGVSYYGMAYPDFCASGSLFSYSCEDNATMQLSRAGGCSCGDGVCDEGEACPQDCEPCTAETIGETRCSADKLFICSQDESGTFWKHAETCDRCDLDRCITEVSCTKSDGFNLNTAGTAIIDNGLSSVKDYCVDDSTLIEHSCNSGMLIAQAFDCRCSRDACQLDTQRVCRQTSESLWHYGDCGGCKPGFSLDRCEERFVFIFFKQSMEVCIKDETTECGPEPFCRPGTEKVDTITCV
jgi:hypothetical protein